MILPVGSLATVNCVRCGAISKNWSVRLQQSEKNGHPKLLACTNWESSAQFDSNTKVPVNNSEEEHSHHAIYSEEKQNNNFNLFWISTKSMMLYFLIVTAYWYFSFRTANNHSKVRSLQKHSFGEEHDYIMGRRISDRQTRTEEQIGNNKIQIFQMNRVRC